MKQNSAVLVAGNILYSEEIGYSIQASPYQKCNHSIFLSLFRWSYEIESFQTQLLLSSCADQPLSAEDRKEDVKTLHVPRPTPHRCQKPMEG